MQVVNNLQNVNPIYSKFYVYNRILRDFKEWPRGLRTEDMWPAACYLHGVYDVPNVVDLPQQLEWLQQHRNKMPKSILEIGGGDGLMSVFLSNVDAQYRIQTVECNQSAEHWIRAVSRQYFDQPCRNNIQLYLGDLDTSWHSIDFSAVDAVVLVASLEHIDSHEWHRFFQRLVPILKNNQGSLTITNYVKYWPLGFPGDWHEHIALIDDSLYNYLASFATKCTVRNGSHLCLEFDH